MTGRALGSALLLVGGLAVSLALAEGVLRWRSPANAHGAADELLRIPSQRREDGPVFTVDPAFGFRPILGTDRYDEHGVIRNAYPLEKRPGYRRLVFLGDSATARGRLVAALAAAVEDERTEFWNAGVESFNAVQEVAYYQRFVSRVDPDHVILVFHMNDFQTTPIAFVDDAGDLVVYTPRRPARRVSAWLFRRSHLYRLWLGRTGAGQADVRAVAEEVEASLRSLRDRLAADGDRFSVVVLPLMKPPDRWTTPERNSRRRILAFLRHERIRHFDLLPALRRALADGVDPQERRGDPWHPSDAVSRVFAADLVSAGLL